MKKGGSEGKVVISERKKMLLRSENTSAENEEIELECRLIMIYKKLL